MRLLYFCFNILLLNTYLSSQEVEDSSYYYHDRREFKKNIDFLNRRITANNYNENLIYKAIDFANLGCAYSLIKDFPNSIEAIKQSLIIDTTNDVVYREADYYYVSQTKEWKALLLDYKKKRGIHLEDELFLNLSRVAINDQAFYSEINFYSKGVNKNTNRVKELWRIKDSLNKQNLKVIEYYLSKKTNVLSVKKVGASFANACFLVIQHSDLKTQKKYLPIIKNLQIKNEISGENYALLYDRVNIEISNGKQYYGTQVNPVTNTVYPIIDEKNVDKRRAELGMESLKNYLELFEINYEPKH